VPIKPRKISDIKPLFTNLAQTSQYEVRFGAFTGGLRQYLNNRGVDSRFTTESAGLLCNSASLPGSTYATADIAGNYTGLMEKVAHTRIFTPIELSFYVDKEYKVIKFLEHWMEYISNASGISPTTSDYFFKMRYPDEYKIDYTKIIKFNRDYNSRNELEYSFFGLFPIAMSSVGVSYESSSTLVASATFNYERYVCGKSYSIDIKRQQANNISPNVSLNNKIVASIDELSQKVPFENNKDVTQNSNLNLDSYLKTNSTPINGPISGTSDSYFSVGI
jgi:hypothetical protein